MTLPENRPMRTLADYRPQHDDDCDVERCEKCNRWHPRFRSPTTILDHFCRCGFYEFRSKPCSCGLSALLGVRRDEQGLEKNNDLSRSDQSGSSIADPRDDDEAVKKWHWPTDTGWMAIIALTMMGFIAGGLYGALMMIGFCVLANVMGQWI